MYGVRGCQFVYLGLEAAECWSIRICFAKDACIFFCPWKSEVTLVSQAHTLHRALPLSSNSYHAFFTFLSGAQNVEGKDGLHSQVVCCSHSAINSDQLRLHVSVNFVVQILCLYLYINRAFDRP